MRQRIKRDFFVIENFEFSGVDYSYTMHRILANYTDAVNSFDSNNWILAIRKEYDTLVENNTFE